MGGHKLFVTYLVVVDWGGGKGSEKISGETWGEGGREGNFC